MGQEPEFCPLPLLARHLDPQRLTVAKKLVREHDHGPTALETVGRLGRRRRKSMDPMRVGRGLLGKTSARTHTPPGVRTRPISAIPAARSVQWRIDMVATTRSKTPSVKGKCSAPARM